MSRKNLAGKKKKGLWKEHPGKGGRLSRGPEEAARLWYLRDRNNVLRGARMRVSRVRSAGQRRLGPSCVGSELG